MVPKGWLPTRANETRRMDPLASLIAAQMLAIEAIAGFEGDGVLSGAKDNPTSVTARLS